MAAYRRVYDSRHLQADCQEPGSAPEPYARQSSMGYPFIEMNSLHGLSDLDVVSTYRRRFPNFVRPGGAGGGRDVPRPRRQHRSAPLPPEPAAVGERRGGVRRRRCGRPVSVGQSAGNGAAVGWAESRDSRLQGPRVSGTRAKL